MEQLYIKIGPLVYHVTSETPLKKGQQFQHFFSDTCDDLQPKRQINCHVKQVEEYSKLQGDLVYQNAQRMIFESEGREIRLFADERGVYGIYREVDDDRIKLELQQNKEEIFVGLEFLEMLALEKFLLKEEALVLHSAYIQWNQEGIVFTAPSGTGKSTQADLWRIHQDAEVINGDRSIIIKNQDKSGFDVCGLPFCGSSGINKDKRYPLKAIVFLHQEEENLARKYDSAKAARKLFGEMSINQWNISFVEKSLNLINTIVKEVSMIDLGCNMQPEATTILRKYIEK